MNFKLLFRATITGGMFGAFLSSWFAPKMISWYFDPPVDIGINCKAATEWSMANLQRAQTYGLVAGMVVGLLLAFWLGRKSPPNAPSITK
jgi:hypothetical protein